MMSEFGSGELPAFGVTGATRLTVTGTLAGGSPAVDVMWCVASTDPLDALVVVEMWSAASLDPAGRFFGSAVIFRSIPSGGIVPEEGVTVSHGLSTVAVKPVESAAVLPLAPEPGMCTVCTIIDWVPYDATESAASLVVVEGVMTIVATSEYGPKPRPQLL